MKTKDFLKQLGHDEIVAAIRDAEQKTSGEIRVFISHKEVKDAVAEAQAQFERLGMTKTALRNGVLLFITSEQRSFVILGDKGIDEKVPSGFWDEIAAKLTIRFRNGEFTDGIVDAISAAGEQLKAYFPRADDDVNELPDDIDVSE